jgi:cytochrome c oxidase accessory protein FixG
MNSVEAYITPASPRSGEVPAEAAAGVAQLDVEAVNAKAKRELYASRPKIYPRAAKGTFRRLKWVVLAITLAIYYLLPWMRWSRGAHLPDQAVLLDFPNRRFFFFFLEIWPQEFYFVTGLLVLAALVLFLVTAVAGRVWCGYFCPQTVWTDLMVAVERFWQGDRNQRLRLEKEPWGFSKIARKAMTHLSFLAIAIATGGAFVFYFRDAPTLAFELVTGTAPMIAYLFIAIFAGTTYLLGGLAREQVCTYMCPWPRIQGAMIDRDSLLVTYRDFRGEPRGPHKKGQPWEGRGDCIDCKACVAVCPMGIDIRDGPQLECIQCALCIDACNEIMQRVERPRNLIAYDTYRSIESEVKGGRMDLRLVRPRTLLYAGLVAVVGVIMLVGVFLRTTLELNVLPDRNPLFVTLADGSIRNGYTLKILNKLHDTRSFSLAIEGLGNARLTLLGTDAAGGAGVALLPDALREIKAYVVVPREQLGRMAGGQQGFTFVVRDTTSGNETRRSTTFRSPGP